jgi:hypothetical protein
LLAKQRRVFPYFLEREKTWREKQHHLTLLQLLLLQSLGKRIKKGTKTRTTKLKKGKTDQTTPSGSISLTHVFLLPILDRALIHSSGTPKRNSKCFLRELLSLSP